MTTATCRRVSPKPEHCIGVRNNSPVTPAHCTTISTPGPLCPRSLARPISISPFQWGRSGDRSGLGRTSSEGPKWHSFHSLPALSFPAGGRERGCQRFRWSRLGKEPPHDRSPQPAAAPRGQSWHRSVSNLAEAVFERGRIRSTIRSLPTFPASLGVYA